MTGLSRTSPHRSVLLVAVCLVAAGTGCSQRIIGVHPPHPTNLAAADLDELDRLARKYALAIVVEGEPFPIRFPSGSVISGKDATREELAAYAPILTSELERYPVDFIRKTGLRRIVLCRDLRKAGLFDYWHSTIYLDITSHPDPARRPQTEASCPSIIHHELFHAVDYNGGWLLCSGWRWKKLTREDGLSPEELDLLHHHSCSPVPGFVCRDGTKSVTEDRAQTFAFLMVDYNKAETLAGLDPIIRRKVDMMKELMFRFSPEIGPEFWEQARARSKPAPSLLAMQLRSGRRQLRPGVDPADPLAELVPLAVVIRPTKCSGCAMITCIINASTCAVTGTDQPVEQLLVWAYRGRMTRVVKTIDLDMGRYDLIASSPPGQPESPRELRRLVRKALEERFGVGVRSESREMDVYVIKLGEQGDRLLSPTVATGDGPGETDAISSQIRGHENEMYFIGRLPWTSSSRPVGGAWVVKLSSARISHLASTLEGYGTTTGELDRPVIDETGLTGGYDIVLECEFGNVQSLIDAAREQLGLYIEPARRPIDVLVVEKRED